jgi:hypothetical protein
MIDGLTHWTRLIVGGDIKERSFNSVEEVSCRKIVDSRNHHLMFHRQTLLINNRPGDEVQKPRYAINQHLSIISILTYDHYTIDQQRSDEMKSSPSKPPPRPQFHLPV